jgi:carbamoyltransferase
MSRVKDTQWILGLNSIGFNTSAALLGNGEIIAAVEEERLIREKKTRKFPSASIRWAMNQATIEWSNLAAIGIAWNPSINLEGHNAAQTARARYQGEMYYSIPSHLMQMRGEMAGEYSEQVLSFENGPPTRVIYVRHHMCHAASFYFSPFEDAAILTVDAFGEKECTTFSAGTGKKIETVWSQEFPQSLGGYYSAMTEYLGFQPQSDEWKLMGASSYGDPKRFLPKLCELVRLDPNGGFELDLSYFNFYQFHRPLRYTLKLRELVGLAPNPKAKPLDQDYYDLAAGAQALFEDIYFHLLNQLHKRTKSKNLVVAGGCALNSAANGKILEKTGFQNVFIPPAPDDSGGCLGAAYYVWHQIFGRERGPAMETNALGPSHSEGEIQETLAKYKVRHRKMNNVAVETARLLKDGKIIGWFQGRMEFGDRALGNRSILADPRDASMKDKVNETVKYREPFRPFAPSILIEHLDEYFKGAVATPFMEKVFPVLENKREQIPAVVHVDGSGRLQTVSRKHNPLYYELISEFKKLTGVPVVLNTSFNLKGEAVVCSPTDALRTFFSSGLDALVLGPFLIEK